jgi:hypothetical protein
MLQWLRRRSKQAPPEPSLGPIQDKEFDGLLAELANGYEVHRPVFRALQVMMHQAERAALRAPTLATPADMEVWKVEQYATIKVAAMLRRALRLPIEGQKLILKKTQAEAVKKVKAEEEEGAELD